MLVRVAIVSLLILFGPAHAQPEQEVTFVLSVQPPKGGDKKHHAAVKTALAKREADLKKAVLPKTKAHPASRVSVTARFKVQPDGKLAQTELTVNWRNVKGALDEAGMKTVIAGVLGATPAVAKQAAGIEVELTVKVLQP